MARSKKFNLPIDGGSISRDDLNLIASSAGSAEDNSISSILVPPAWNGGVQRGILPPRNITLVSGNGVNSVRCAAHAAYAGPMTDLASTINTAFTDNAVMNVDSSTGANPRYDLLYETIYVDIPAVTAYRKVKNRTSKVVSASAFSNSSSCYTTVGLVKGTESATPTSPSLPADPVGGYNIPLAYIRIPTTYTGGSATIDPADIFEVAPVLTGPGVARPSSSSSKVPASPDGTGRQGITFNQLYRFLAAPMAGSESRMFGVSALTGLMADGTIIDDSIDWRNRIFRADVHAAQLGFETYAWNSPSLGVPGAGTSLAGTSVVARVMGNSFGIRSGGTVQALRVDSGLLSWASSNYIEIDVDSSGRLIFHKNADWNCTAFIWLEASAPMANSRVHNP